MAEERLRTEEIDTMFKVIGAGLTRPMDIYVIGGGAMAFRGDKDSTKDLDLVVVCDEDGRRLMELTQELGFQVNARPPPGCQGMIDAVILTASHGERIDIFTKVICGRLTFSEAMVRRAELLKRSGLASLWLASREDIFLLKSVTERDKDLDDMLVLFQRGLDRKIIIEECGRQTERYLDTEKPIYEAFLAVKLEELERHGGVEIPWRREVHRTAEAKVTRAMMRLVEGGAMKDTDMASRLGITPAAARRELNILMKSGHVVIEADGTLRSDRGKG